MFSCGLESASDGAANPCAIRPSTKYRVDSAELISGSDSDSISASSKGFSEGDDSSGYRSKRGLKEKKVPRGTSSRSSGGISRRSTPQVSGLRAGFVDDNKQYNYFINFLNKFRNQARALNINVSERIKIQVKDKKGNSLPNCKIVIKNQNDKIIYSGKTYADGTFLFFPSETKSTGTYFKGTATYQQKKKSFHISRYGKRNLQVRFNFTRGIMKNVPLDIVFVLDTTGSMGEEIQRLKTTIDIMHLNVTSFSSRPRVRFGMVLYKDKGDEYRTKVIPLTSNIDKFKEKLDKVSAAGGGDFPEDLQEALKDTLTKLRWRNQGIRLAFIITDAPPHLDYNQNFTYIKASQSARKKAIKLFSIGTGGLPLQGEYILRQIAQYTYANYIFLNYGEKGESHGGRVGSVSHHTGANYNVSKLESLVIRITKKELSYLTNQPLTDKNEYFLAQKVSDQSKDEIIKELFNKAISQLIDYSTISLTKKTPTSVLPIIPKSPSVKADAEYFTEQLILSMSKNTIFKLIERADLQKILQEQTLQSSDLYDEKKSVKLGRLIGAKYLVVGKLYKRRKNLNMILKLVRVKTGEILSVTKIKIDKKLKIET